MVSQENSLQDFPKIIFLSKKIGDWLAQPHSVPYRREFPGQEGLQETEIPCRMKEKKMYGKKRKSAAGIL